ncbi:hypothetical protein GZ77_02440 [Endozoicomonas montiporae]|uniref:Transmembrane protein n=2 Tax=Endozoicomonas montiporae TaxID=1027273 RepID=A0A081NAN7_9GAMM|nr:DUF924 family protein [Endozoicomonas montiporae]AMO56805.1 hypothetical protein EZMO1_2755 [Endozoicomonas montiporae CL-33]KEQ15510.1 hypothetical protein GZ77_02440 [Endozoicomonas montiporae]
MSSQQVLDFWFAGETLGKAQIKRWWHKDPAADAEITSRFSELVTDVHQQLGDKWSEQAEGRLAAIICLDQFPRNMYRGDPRSFYYDQKALELCQQGINEGAYSDLPPLWQTFFFMPLMHSEKLSDQNDCVEWFARLVEQTDGALKEYLSGSLDFARKHQGIVQRFGRYPHRNEILGRESTPEELTFLSQPGSSF